MDDYLAKPFKAESLLRVIKLGVKPSLMIPIDTVETTATIESAINVEPVINVGAL
jgi:DNA-binding response OmpR family regulator